MNYLHHTFGPTTNEFVNRDAILNKIVTTPIANGKFLDSFPLSYFQGPVDNTNSILVNGISTKAPFTNRDIVRKVNGKLEIIEAGRPTSPGYIGGVIIPTTWDVISIARSANSRTIAVLLSNGDVWGWGDNTNGVLTPGGGNITTPVLIMQQAVRILFHVIPPNTYDSLIVTVSQLPSIVVSAVDGTALTPDQEDVFVNTGTVYSTIDSKIAVSVYQDYIPDDTTHRNSITVRLIGQSTFTATSEILSEELEYSDLIEWGQYFYLTKHSIYISKVTGNDKFIALLINYQSIGSAMPQGSVVLVIGDNTAQISKPLNNNKVVDLPILLHGEMIVDIHSSTGLTMFALGSKNRLYGIGDTQNSSGVNIMPNTSSAPNDEWHMLSDDVYEIFSDKLSGDTHTFIRKLDGTVWGMGLNDAGQLGVGNTNPVSDFVQVQLPPNTNISHVDVSTDGEVVFFHTMAGAIYVTGETNTIYSLGVSTSGGRSLVPTLYEP